MGTLLDDLIKAKPSNFLEEDWKNIVETYKNEEW
jgi:hypothetical protein